MKKQITLSMLLILTSMTTFSQESTWKFVKETNGVKVYFRTIANSNLNEVKIQTTFNSNLSTIVEALRDVNAYREWVYKAAYSYTVKEFSANEMEYYNKFNFPFPLDDRDVVIHSKILQNPQNKVVTSVSYAKLDIVPENKNVVRIKDFHSKWTFIAKNNLVYGEYIFKSNPGGNIPAWLINLSLDEGPIKTIQNFKQQLQLDKYIKANSLGILN
jgi:hypothetical protein